MAQGLESDIKTEGYGKEDFIMIMLTGRVSFNAKVLDIAIYVDFMQLMLGKAKLFTPSKLTIRTFQSNSHNNVIHQSTTHVYNETGF